MRYLILWMLLGVVQLAPAATLVPADNAHGVTRVENAHTRQHKGKWLKRLKTFRPFRELDRLAVWAIAFGATPILCGLIGFAIGGGFAGVILFLFASPFIMVGFVIGLIAVIRAFKEGWKRRGTVWAVVAMALPIIFLLLFMSGSFS